MRNSFHVLSFLWLYQVDGLFLRDPSRRSLLAGLTQVVVFGKGPIAQAASEDAPIHCLCRVQALEADEVGRGN